MEGFDSEGRVQGAPNPADIKQFEENPAEDTVFDASQYAFFGKDAVDEVELGGLEDEEDDTLVGGIDEEEFLFEKGEDFQSTSSIDDFAITYSKLNKVVSGPGSTGDISDRGSRESSSVTELAQEDGFANWLDQHAYDSEYGHEGKRWSSHPYSSSHVAESNSLHRTSSYPDQQQQQQHRRQHFSSDPIRVPNSPFTSYPGRMTPQSSPNQHSGNLNFSYTTGRPQMALPSSNLTPFPNTQIQLTGLRRGSQFGGNMPQLSTGLSINSGPLNLGSYPPKLMNDMLQELRYQNGLGTSKSEPQQQQHRLHHPLQPPIGHLPGFQNPHLYNPHLSSGPPLLSNFEAMHGLPDMSDQRPISAQKVRLNMHFFQPGFDTSSHMSNNGWPQFRSKYMTADEIDGILRVQLAATHSNDPYVDDYYHQACLAKKSDGAKLRHHFCPTQLRDLPPHARAHNEPHAFLQVDALGRVPFSSIRRPRPLLEVESSNTSISDSTEQKILEKPLEEEPMLAARVTIEDGLCLLLDIDDIDRFLHFNQLQDGGAQLRRRRQLLLEQLLASIQLVDPLGKDGHMVGFAPKNDFLFLRLASLPKGRKLLARYLKLLHPGSELMQIVCMAIFRHLRFLFGGLPSDIGAAETTDKLVRVVSSCVHGMDLGALSACLAAVVCSSKKPSLRPLGNPTRDGASLILKSVLERATQLLTDPHAASNYNRTHRELWQAAFDEFFGLLTRYCVNKYDSIMQAMHMQAPENASLIGSDAAIAISKEIPIELLRATLPHTDEHQRKLLLNFAQRSVPVVGLNNSNGGASGGTLNSESRLS